MVAARKTASLSVRVLAKTWAHGESFWSTFLLGLHGVPPVLNLQDDFNPIFERYPTSSEKVPIQTLTRHPPLGPVWPRTRHGGHSLASNTFADGFVRYPTVAKGNSLGLLIPLENLPSAGKLPKATTLSHLFFKQCATLRSLA